MHRWIDVVCFSHKNFFTFPSDPFLWARSGLHKHFCRNSVSQKRRAENEKPEDWGVMWWEGCRQVGDSAAVQCTSGVLDVSVYYLEVFSCQHRDSKQSQCWALCQKTSQEKIPKRIVPENLSILYIHLCPWTHLFRPITRYLFAKVGQDLQWVYPDLLGFCVLFFLLWNLSQLRMEMLVRALEWQCTGRKLLEKEESKVHSSHIEDY